MFNFSPHVSRQALLPSEGRVWIRCGRAGGLASDSPVEDQADPVRVAGVEVVAGDVLKNTRPLTA